MDGDKHLYICRVCGLDHDPFMPWGADAKSPTSDICSCCGTEFGYEDATIKGIRNHRQKWLNGPENWFIPDDKPVGWSAEDQLKNIPDEYK